MEMDGACQTRLSPHGGMSLDADVILSKLPRAVKNKKRTYWPPHKQLTLTVGDPLGSRVRGNERRRGHGQAVRGGMEERIDSMFPPVFRPNMVPRS